MKVFLTGATGYIGTAVAEALAAAGHSVTGLARSDEAEEKLRRKGHATHRGDLKSPHSLLKAAKAADGVIHAGSTNDGALDKAAVKAVLDELRGSKMPFIYTSGVWVLGDTHEYIADETAPLHPAAISAWRPEVERMVLDSVAHGVHAMIIRPGVVYGRGGGIPADFFKSAIDTGSALYVGSGANHWPVVHVDDLAKLYVRALSHAPAGILLHAVDTSFHSVTEIAEAASQGAGADGKTTSWPLEEARKVLGSYADALVLDQHVSAEKAKAMLGWHPKAEDILDDLRKGPPLQ